MRDQIAACSTFRNLNNAELLPIVQQGAPYVDGKPVAPVSFTGELVGAA